MNNNHRQQYGGGGFQPMPPNAGPSGFNPYANTNNPTMAAMGMMNTMSGMHNPTYFTMAQQQMQQQQQQQQYQLRQQMLMHPQQQHAMGYRPRPMPTPYQQRPPMQVPYQATATAAARSNALMNTGQPFSIATRPPPPPPPPSRVPPPVPHQMPSQPQIQKGRTETHARPDILMMTYEEYLDSFSEVKGVEKTANKPSVPTHIGNQPQQQDVHSMTEQQYIDYCRTYSAQMGMPFDEDMVKKHYRSMKESL